MGATPSCERQQYANLLIGLSQLIGDGVKAEQYIRKNRTCFNTAWRALSTHERELITTPDVFADASFPAKLYSAIDLSGPEFLDNKLSLHAYLSAPRQLHEEFWEVQRRFVLVLAAFDRQLHIRQASTPNAEWCRAGGSYIEFCRKFGLGVLYYLPTSKRSIFERTGQQGQRRDAIDNALESCLPPVSYDATQRAIDTLSYIWHQLNLSGHLPLAENDLWTTADVLWNIMLSIREPLPISILIWATRPHHLVWDEKGEKLVQCLNVSKLNPGILRLLDCEESVRGAISVLQSRNLITERSDYLVCISGQESNARASIICCQFWVYQMLRLLLFIFPKHPFLEPLYGPCARALVPFIRSLLELNMDRILLPKPEYRYIAEQLTWICRFKPMTHYIAVAESYLHSKVPCALQIMIVRSKRQPIDPLPPLKNYKHDHLATILYGEMVLDDAQHLIYNGDAVEALDTIKRHKVVFEASTALGKCICRRRDIMMSDICRFLGRFDEAFEYVAHEDQELDMVYGRRRIVALAGVYCELDRPEKAIDVCRMEERGSDGFGDGENHSRFCLKIRLTEALMLAGREMEATQRAKEQLQCSSGRMVTRLNLVLAMAAHKAGNWMESVGRWQAIRETLGEKKGGFVDMIALYSIAYAHYQGNGDSNYAHQALGAANRIYQSVQPEYWFLGLTKYLKDIRAMLLAKIMRVFIVQRE